MNATQLADVYLNDISNEPDPERRRVAIRSLFATDVVYTDQDGTVRGRDAFTHRITELADMMTPGSRFTLVYPAQAVGDAVIFHWRLGSPTSAPLLQGTDVAVLQHGKIVRLYAVLTPEQTDTRSVQ